MQNMEDMDKPQREGQIPKEMNMLKAEIAGLQETCSSLEKRLSSVLRDPIPKEGKEPERVKEPKVELARRIELASTEIADCAYKLQDILDRLELE